MAENQLTELRIKNFQPQERIKRLWDGGGLYLEVTPAGSKLWRFRYKMNYKERRLSLGSWPKVNLKEARDRRDQLKAQVLDGIDPGVERKKRKREQFIQNECTFEKVCERWIKNHQENWVPSYKYTVELRLNRYVLPKLGKMSIDTITAHDAYLLLKDIEDAGIVDTAQRCRGLLGQIFRFAVALGLCPSDPTRDLKGALKPHRKQHYATILDPYRLGQVLLMADNYTGSTTTRNALLFSFLTAQRPGEIRTASWSDLDFDKCEWNFVASKTGIPHTVPLSRQAIEILQECQAVSRGSEFVFPHARSRLRPISDNTVNLALRALGVEADELVAHGIRACFRTLAEDELKYRPEPIEMQLAHVVRDSLGRAYNRTKLMDERIALMQDWADFLDNCRDLARGKNEK